MKLKNNFMKAKILFKFATRSRPDKFITGINNIFSKVSDKENFQILVSADSNDTSMYNQEVMNKIKDHLDSGKIIMSFGESKSKIDAINRDMQLVDDWNILMNFRSLRQTCSMQCMQSVSSLAD